MVSGPFSIQNPPHFFILRFHRLDSGKLASPLPVLDINPVFPLFFQQQFRRPVSPTMSVPLNTEAGRRKLATELVGTLPVGEYSPPLYRPLTAHA